MAIDAPDILELSSDSDNDFDAPIGHPSTFKLRSKPTPTVQSRLRKRPASPAPAPPPARPAKKARVSGAQAGGPGWDSSELARLMDMHDAQRERGGGSNYDEIAGEFPDRSRKDLQAAVYRAKKRQGGRASVGERQVPADDAEQRLVSGAEGDSAPPDSRAASDQPPAVQLNAGNAKRFKPRASLTTPWTPADLSRLIAAYDDTVAAHGRPRYDLICTGFPNRTKESLQTRVSLYKKRLAKEQAGAGGPPAATGAAAVAGGAKSGGAIEAWLARPAVTRARPRLSREEMRAVRKKCKAVLKMLRKHAAEEGVEEIE